jgi:hypothetical protein
MAAAKARFSCPVISLSGMRAGRWDALPVKSQLGEVPPEAAVPSRRMDYRFNDSFSHLLVV